MDYDINVSGISKIEGHAELYVKVRKGKVKDVQLKISESKRYFSQAIEGKHFSGVPSTASRICGTCSPAHMLCSIEAIEKGFGVRVSPQTLELRKLLMNAMNIRDHAMHLYFFSLPDFLGRDSVLDFRDNEQKWVRDAFRVKSLGNILGKTVGGRSVHPTYPVVGGFIKVPGREETGACLKALKESRDTVLDIMDFFISCPQTFSSRTHYVALVNNDYTFLEGRICSSRGLCIEEDQYLDHLWRVIIPYSSSTGFELHGEEFMVGALSRMNLNKKNLHRDTRRDAKKHTNIFPTDCIYHNNLAQAIEILHCIDKSIESLEASEFRKEEPVKFEVRAAKGVGVVEAPRGTLYHSMDINPQGTINEFAIVIPTAQNTITLQRDIRDLVQQMTDMKQSKHSVYHECEKLIRAYDPCMSCATHFLRMKWV